MALTKAEREVVRAKFGGRCAYCGCLLEQRWHADHFEPVERKLAFHREKGVVSTNELRHPERDTVANSMPACPPCNIDKSTFSLEQWRAKLQRSCEVLQRNQPTYRHALRFGLVVETQAPVTFYFERLQQGADPVQAVGVASK
ncbi:HNH endonuclease [Burkholderia ubonensis]|uniref:HNH endonuclease n=1 Tax=Burkholderia ubonensis TaxID=101571 RepID=A0A106QCD0_9BURK|nr:HNH endonuclease signature motif containing protein [Burkholderia ubonensis]KWA84283.1 HNH endonuclease [Burkholderia ubonensis]